MQQHALPDGILAIELPCHFDGDVHQLLVLDVDGSLEEEARRVSILLRTMVLEESTVVTAKEGHQPLQLVIAPRICSTIVWSQG